MISSGGHEEFSVWNAKAIIKVEVFNIFFHFCDVSSSETIDQHCHSYRCRCPTHRVTKIENFINDIMLV